MWFLIGFKISEAPCLLGVSYLNGLESPEDSEALEWPYNSEYETGQVWGNPVYHEGKKKVNGAA